MCQNIMGFWFFSRKKDDEINKLKNNLNGSFSNIKKDISLINGVLSFFKEKHQDYDRKFERLERDFAYMGGILEEIRKKSTVKNIPLRSSVHERSRAFKRSNQAFMNVQSLQNLKENLTPAQKRVIQMLNLAEIPLEYEDIAKDLKLSIVTIRRHISDIKRMGFDVKEKMNIDTKRKVFYIEKEIKKAIRSKR